jgi:hypothetical protein
MPAVHIAQPLKPNRAPDGKRKTNVPLTATKASPGDVSRGFADRRDTLASQRYQ